MFGEFKFDLSGTNAILLILIVGAALLLFYMEIKRLKIQIQDIIKKVESISVEPKNISMDEVSSEIKVDEIPNSFIPTTSELNNFPIIQENIDRPMDDISRGDNSRGDISRGDISREDISPEDISREEIKDISENLEDTINSLMLSSEEELEQLSDEDTVSDLGSEEGSDVSDMGSDIVSDKDVGESESYDNSTVNELKSILSDMNLPLSGNKTKLIQRIKDNKS